MTRYKVGDLIVATVDCQPLGFLKGDKLRIERINTKKHVTATNLHPEREGEMALLCSDEYDRYENKRLLPFMKSALKFSLYALLLTVVSYCVFVFMSLIILLASSYFELSINSTFVILFLIILSVMLGDKIIGKGKFS